MKTKLICCSILFLFIIGCKSPDVTEPAKAPNYSGQYQAVPYQNSDEEPVVLLLLSQESNTVTGTGSWNGITFNFNGTIIDKHVIFTFELKGTNYNDLNGSIDTFVGNDLSLAGGYKLWNSGNILVGPIRFKNSSSK